MERPQACRPFHLFDAMILVAAAAFATFFTKILVDFDGTWNASSDASWESRWGVAYGWTCPSFVAATVALVLIRLRRPRPSLRRLSRQPGFVALGAVTAILFLALLVALSATAMIVLRGESLEDNVVYWTFSELISSHVGMVVAAVWLVQGVGRRWRPERGWIDDSGRLLGFCWIVSLLIGWWLTFLVQLTPGAGVPPIPLPAPPSILQPPPGPDSSDRTDSPRPDTAP